MACSPFLESGDLLDEGKNIRESRSVFFVQDETKDRVDSRSDINISNGESATDEVALALELGVEISKLAQKNSLQGVKVELLHGDLETKDLAKVRSDETSDFSAGP